MASGHLIFAREGSLWAVPFDPARLEIRGEPVPVVENVEVNTTGFARYDVSEDGTLVYLPAGSGLERSLVWVDRQGREEPVAAAPYDAPSISPDGRLVALQVSDPDDTDVIVYDLARDTVSFPSSRHCERGLHRGGFSLGKNVRGGTRPRLSCGRSWL